MLEPRSIPVYPPEAMVKNRQYCFDCVHQTHWESEMKTHHTGVHGTETPMRDLDYGGTDRILWMIHQRAAWIELQSLSFGLEMHEGFGADDFAAEAEIRDA